MLSRMPVTSRGERDAASPRRLARDDEERSLVMSSEAVGPKPGATKWRPSEDDLAELLHTNPVDSPDRRCDSELTRRGGGAGGIGGDGWRTTGGDAPAGTARGRGNGGATVATTNGCALTSPQAVDLDSPAATPALRSAGTDPPRCCADSTPECCSEPPAQPASPSGCGAWLPWPLLRRRRSAMRVERSVSASGGGGWVG
jgi:hypothetical protein